MNKASARALVVGLIGFAISGASPAFAQTAYTSDAVFTAATLGKSFNTQSFEGTPTSTSTSLDFGNVIFSCSGTTYCPGFFGQDTSEASDGTKSVYFATPDTATFSFSSTTYAFGIDVLGLGTRGTTNFFVDVGTGAMPLQQNFSQSTEGLTFAGVTSSTGFNSVTFSATQANDGINFDRLRFSATPSIAAAVPEPATWSMMILGFGFAGYALRRRRATTRVTYAV